MHDIGSPVWRAVNAAMGGSEITCLIEVLKGHKEYKDDLKDLNITTAEIIPVLCCC